jgi:hypothetical protein
VQDRYDEKTLALEKVLDEVELERAARERVEAVLTPVQRALVLDAKTRDVRGVDLYSPVLMLSTVAESLPKGSRDLLKGRLVELWMDAWEVEEPHRAILEIAAEETLRALEGRLGPFSKGEAAWFRLDDAVAAGRATLAAMKQVLQARPGEETRKAVTEAKSFFVPRLLKEAK